jgi:hypothetical protein
VSEFPEFAEGLEKIDNPDGDASRPYYYNAKTMVSQWDPPWKLPPNWREYEDADGTPYYNNRDTGATLWERPWILPEGWKEYADTDGTPYFDNPGTGGRVWDRPYPIPKGWKEYAEAGTQTPYFYHGTLGITTWDRPWPLPDGWLICKTGDDEVYYAEGGGSVQWDRPLLGEFAPDGSDDSASTAAPGEAGPLPIPSAEAQRTIILIAAAAVLGACFLCAMLFVLATVFNRKPTPRHTPSAVAPAVAPGPQPVQAPVQKQPVFGGVNAFGVPIDSSIESDHLANLPN